MFVRALKKDKKEDAEKNVKKQKTVIDDKDRHKPYGKTAWAPVDDVHILRYYPRTIYDAADAVDMLKSFQLLDFTPHKQPVYIDLKLDMKLEKKVMVVFSSAESGLFPSRFLHTHTLNSCTFLDIFFHFHL